MTSLDISVGADLLVMNFFQLLYTLRKVLFCLCSCKIVLPGISVKVFQVDSFSFLSVL